MFPGACAALLRPGSSCSSTQSMYERVFFSAASSEKSKKSQPLTMTGDGTFAQPVRPDSRVSETHRTSKNEAERHAPRSGVCVAVNMPP